MNTLEYYKKHQGQLETKAKHPIKTQQDLATAYSPGVAEPCKHITKHPEAVHTHTLKARTVAIITDASAVLGLGNLSPYASIPVMEGKAVLLKEFANLDAFPIALNTKETNKIIETTTHIEPVFAAINLEDIQAPKCFEIEQQLDKQLNIPVFHDDQHGTAIVVQAALHNALNLTNKQLQTSKIVINGAGAAGVAITKLLHQAGARNLVVCDRQGSIHNKRKNLPKHKQELAQLNTNNHTGTLHEVLNQADVFIGVSAPNLLEAKHIQTMNQEPIIFALANPEPEITPKEAKKGGASITATGRSNDNNQINNVLAFPGIFKGAIAAQATTINNEMKQAAAHALANHTTPTKEQLLPQALDKTLAQTIANAVEQAAKKTNVTRK